MPALRESKSTCCYCGVGCGVLIQSEGGQITGVRGDPEHPANFGKLCSKGSTLHLTAQPAAMAARAHFPELRRSRELARTRVSWDEAMDFAVHKFAATIQEHGPNAVAFYLSGQLFTEDYYVFNKLVKALIGSNNIDSNSRLCMSSAVSGYQKTLGADAPPCNYTDLEHAQCLLIAGANMAYAHPILFRRIEAARARDPQRKLIVVDPRQTDTARCADLHLAILPGTDVALFHAMLHVMLWEGLTDQAYIARHTSGFEGLRNLVRDYSPQNAAEICGVPADDIVTAARWFAQSPASLSLYCQGLNQSSSGTAKNASLINLHLATGQIGKPGAGPFSLTGQPNAMGGREVGGLATMLAAHRELANPKHRAEMQQLWGVDKLSAEPGLTAVEIFDALKRGEIKAIWIACTNPAQSLPDLPQVRAALEKAELVVLQEAYADTETAAFADLLLPASSWGEKTGTVTNSERCISLVRAATQAPGEARHDWQIACEFAQRLETHLAPGRATLFAFPTPESVWNEHRECTRGRDLDITGLSYATLERDGPQHWPYPSGASGGQARLYEDGIFPTEDGRARFYEAAYKPVAEAVDARFPFRLITGRLRDQWHGMSRTGTLANLFGHAPEPRLAMNPADMARRNLSDGQLLQVTSRRGALHVVVEADPSMRSGQAYLPMHWGKRFLGGKDSEGVNTLTLPAFDPISRQPELKHAAVKVSAAELPWRMVAFAEVAPERLAPTFQQLQALQHAVVFASAVLIGRERPGVLLRVAHTAPPALPWFTEVDRVLGLDGEHTLRYDDARRNSSRRIQVQADRLLAVRLAGDLSAITSGEWLKDWLVSGKPIAEIRRLLLSPASQAPSGFSAPGRVICQCWNVSEQEIGSVLTELEGDSTARFQRLQAQLKCGTNCGSCSPELRQLLAKYPARTTIERTVV